MLKSLQAIKRQTKLISYVVKCCSLKQKMYKLVSKLHALMYHSSIHHANAEIIYQ